MNILMISTDKKIFEEQSPVRQRMFNYGTVVDQLHIIVLNKKFRGEEDRKKFKIGEKVFVYPTNSLNKFHYASDAKKIALFSKDLDLVTAQDPYETG